MAQTKAPRGISLHIGVNKVDPDAYSQYFSTLKNCEYDADDMRNIALENGYDDVTLLLDHDARVSKVIGIIENAADVLMKDDVFFLTYAGHGSFIQDFDGDEADATDETWCLYDDQLLDDEIWTALKKFRSGVGIYIVTDCCHSETNVRAPVYNVLQRSVLGPNEQSTISNNPVFRTLPPSMARKISRDGDERFRERLRQRSHSPLLSFFEHRNQLSAQVHHLSACLDTELAAEFPFDQNGLFTEHLLRVLIHGKFSGDFYDLVRAVDKSIKMNQPAALQTPSYYRYGTNASRFGKADPFQIPNQ